MRRIDEHEIDLPLPEQPNEKRTQKKKKKKKVRRASFEGATLINKMAKRKKRRVAIDPIFYNAENDKVSLNDAIEMLQSK